MMSKQAWRVVLKKEQKHKGRDREREREKSETEKEEKVRGTAQESFHHEAQKNETKTTNHHIQ